MGALLEPQGWRLAVGMVGSRGEGGCVVRRRRLAVVILKAMAVRHCCSIKKEEREGAWEWGTGRRLVWWASLAPLTPSGHPVSQGWYVRREGGGDDVYQR